MPSASVKGYGLSKGTAIISDDTETIIDAVSKSAYGLSYICEVFGSEEAGYLIGTFNAERFTYPTDEQKQIRLAIEGDSE